MGWGDEDPEAGQAAKPKGPQQRPQWGDSDPDAGAPRGAKPKGGKRRQSPMQTAYGAAATFNRNFLPFSDELSDAVEAGVNIFSGKAGNIGEAWRQARDKAGAAEAGFQAEHPKAAALTRGTAMAGGAVVPVGGTANLFKAPLTVAGRTLPQAAVNAGRGAVLAGGQAAGYAAADRGAAAERLRGASQAATNPVTLALGAAAGGLPSLAAKPKPTPARTVDELRAAKSRAYEEAENAGVRYAPDAFADMVNGITAEARAGNISPTRHPRATSMLRDLQKMKGQALTLTQLDQLRQVIRRDLMGSSDASERFFGQKMIANIDEFVDAAGPGQVVGGDAGRGAASIKRARDLNTRYRKLETLQGLDEAAQERAASTGTGSNIDNATRQDVRRFKAKTPNLTPEERAAAERVIRGQPGQNLLRAVGRLSPEGGTVSQVAGLVTGLASGGTLPAIGFVARRVADAITRRNLDELARLIAGSDETAVAAQRELERLAATDPAAQALRRDVAARLSRTAGVAGGSGDRSSRNIYAQP